MKVWLTILAAVSLTACQTASMDAREKAFQRYTEQEQQLKVSNEPLNSINNNVSGIR